MKTEYIAKKEKGKIPMVGQAWKMDTYDEIFIRIPDEQGRLALGWKLVPATVIFSSALSSGEIGWINTSEHGVVPLVPKGGKLEFVAE